MPVYTYRREDGTTFDFKQKFLDDPLTIDPETGQRVVRIVQPTSIIFKGSGFYVNDSKGKSSTMAAPPADTKADTSSAAKPADSPAASVPAPAKAEASTAGAAAD